MLTVVLKLPTCAGPNPGQCGAVRGSCAIQVLQVLRSSEKIVRSAAHTGHCVHACAHVHAFVHMQDALIIHVRTQACILPFVCTTCVCMLIHMCVLCASSQILPRFDQARPPVNHFHSPAPNHALQADLAVANGPAPTHHMQRLT